jgi:heterodisulfide reductase subunit E
MAVHAYYPGLVPWIVPVLAAVVCIAGTFLLLTRWGHGRPDRFFASWAREAFRKGIVAFLQFLVVDVLLFSRVFARSRRRWIVHMTIFWVFMVLLLTLLVSVVAILLQILNPDGAGGAFYGYLTSIQIPYSLLAYPLILATGIALARRLILRDVRKRTRFSDYGILVVLLLLGLFGMLAEWFSGFDLIVGKAFLNWDLALTILGVHMYITFLLFVMILPFTRFRHILATPLLLLARRGGG